MYDIRQMHNGLFSNGHNGLVSAGDSGLGEGPTRTEKAIVLECGARDVIYI